jgi:amino acid transporter
MSLARMVELGIERQQEVEAQTRGVRRAPQPAKGAVGSAMERISAFIPSEVIGIYVAGFGILSPQQDSEKWWIFAISMALIPIFMLLNFIGQRKKRNLKVSARISLVLLLFALVAFIAWAAALPGTPFLSLTPRATAIGGWTVVILAVVMYQVADLLDVVPKG